MDRVTITRWLRERDPRQLAELWHAADRVRRERVGDAVHLRGLVEVSSYCRRTCAYCGIRAGSRSCGRYRMDAPEVIDCAHQIARFGCGTIVLQAGEDSTLDGSWWADLVRWIKRETSLAVTLSLGERPLQDFALLRAAGADRYLLRFETSNAEVYRRVHPPLSPNEPTRRELLAELRALGFELGSGVMVGLPGTTYEDLTNDLLLVRDLDLDMIGLGPYVPHPDTPLGRLADDAPAPDQVPGDVPTTCTAVALARLLCPDANIPATTALATLGPDGRTAGLNAGANVWMPNFTPARYRPGYAIYPGKATADPDGPSFDQLSATLAGIGRLIGHGAGSSATLGRRSTRRPGDNHEEKRP